MYYDRNMQVLQEYRHYLCELLQKHSLSEVECNIKVDSISTRTQDKALVVEKDGLQYRLNSKYNPKDEAEKWAERYNAKNLDTVFTMFGFGNGLFIRELAKKLTKENRLIIYEPSFCIFMHTLEEYDLEDIIKNNNVLIIIQDINEYELPYLLSATLTWMNLFSKVECLHPEYDKLFPDAYSDYKRLLQDNVFNNVVAKNTYGLMGKPIVKNSITNLIHLKNSISIWDLEKKLPKDIPVIIAAAGPSLNKNIDELKAAKGRSILIAVDRAYETFMAHGIEPDFVVALDALKLLKYCGNVKGFKVPLLCKHEASPDILDNHNGKKIIFSFEGFTAGIYKKIGKDYTSIPSGGSVATAAFSVIARLGFQRVVLIGNDMAYDGELSRSGTIQEAMTENQRSIELFVDGLNGNKVRTRHDWYTFLRWFEAVIMQMRSAEVINATEGGANIKGTRIMKLKDVVEQYCNEPFDCAKMIEETEPSFNEKDFSEIHEYLKDSKKDIVEIKSLMQEAMSICSSLAQIVERGHHLGGQSEVMRSITDINSKIEEKPVYSLINYYVLGEGAHNIGELFFMTNNDKTDDYITVKNMTNIYRISLEACDFILPKVEEAITYYL
ncbi:MAG: hypothetical protein K0R46_2554 [Herbinix sp.]|nr:hypothetical protein [Herbinix sp.]